MSREGMSLDDAISGRMSVRSFRADPVDRTLVMGALEAASRAPSPHGTQPWRFVLLEKPEIRRGLADAMAASWGEQLRLDTEDQAVVDHRIRRSRERLEQAPILVLFCLYLGDAQTYPDAERQASEVLMAVHSLGAAAQNFLLAIHARGLSTGWMCAPLFCPDVIRNYLGLDSALEPQALFPVGLMDAPPKRRERCTLDTLVIEIDS